ncbi:hypothetical protein BS47DRAFT_1368459 [Hydnum rufescens UP504]|uniref:Uncharacterized protein n=1 Tax=Hydnum rufescens UP504 TaxID=1448309 RepID=A0A9P6AFZ2_9AGAM|nr:hypothetical protein BS47DRAFT_1368459 [Hydnum rufescens UP504]
MIPKYRALAQVNPKPFVSSREVLDKTRKYSIRTSERQESKATKEESLDADFTQSISSGHPPPPSENTQAQNELQQASQKRRLEQTQVDIVKDWQYPFFTEARMLTSVITWVSSRFFSLGELGQGWPRWTVVDGKCFLSVEGHKEWEIREDRGWAGGNKQKTEFKGRMDSLAHISRDIHQT